MRDNGVPYSSLIDWPTCTGRCVARDFVTPLAKAVATLTERRKDLRLRARVEEYLGGDVPDYFCDQPLLYLCRHVASPNIETLRFLAIAKKQGLKTVIGQDPKDIFAPRNKLKHALGMLAIVTRLATKGERKVEGFRRVRIIDFNAAGGKPLNALRTLWGEPLVEFHNGLFGRLLEEAVQIEDDSMWVDRYHRGDLLSEYKKFLALFIFHGVMLEDYLTESSAEEERFVTDILRPAIEHVEAAFGVRPLIAPLVPCGVASFDVWTGYPPQILGFIQERIRG